MVGFLSPDIISDSMQTFSIIGMICSMIWKVSGVGIMFLNLKQNENYENKYRTIRKLTKITVKTSKISKITKITVLRYEITWHQSCPVLHIVPLSGFPRLALTYGST